METPLTLPFRGDDMPIIANGTNITDLIYNGVDITTVYANNVLVFQKEGIPSEYSAFKNWFIQTATDSDSGFGGQSGDDTYFLISGGFSEEEWLDLEMKVQEFEALGYLYASMASMYIEVTFLI
jgi:hypothetical protein